MNTFLNRSSVLDQIPPFLLQWRGTVFRDGKSSWTQSLQVDIYFKNDCVNKKKKQQTTNKSQTTKILQRGVGVCVCMSVNSLIEGTFENIFVLQNQRTELDPSGYLLPMAVKSSLSQLSYKV